MVKYKGISNMKKSIILLAVAALVSFVSCSKEPADLNVKAPEAQAELVPMSFRVNVADTRTTFSDLHVYWESGDELNVIEVDGDGVLRGQHDFSYVSGEGSSSAVFSGSVVSASNTFYAVYPNVKLYDATIGTTVVGSTIELASLGQDASAVRGGFDPAMALMTAVADGSSFTFRHAVAYIKLRALGSEIVSVKITSSGDARIYGRPVITLSTGAPSAVNGSAAGSNVTLSGTFAKDGEYLIPITIAPGQKLGTLKFFATNTEGTTSEITTTALSDVVPEAGHIYKVGMPPFDFGHEYVDLGLPSGTLWATTNVGAALPSESGDYIAWGEVEPYYTARDLSAWSTDHAAGYTLASYCGASTWTNGMMSYMYENDADSTGMYKLLPEYDFATARWGDDWRTPTLKQYKELANTSYTTWEKVASGDKSTNLSSFTATVDGWLVFKGTDSSLDTSKYIFLPNAGRLSAKKANNATYLYLWSSNVYQLGTAYKSAWMLTEISGTIKADNYGSRYFGNPIRAVAK